MDSQLSRALIERIVRQALRGVEDSPGRSARNLVDMALAFSDGPFQQRFFQAAQRILASEGAYAALLRDAAATVDNERLLTFGLNLGYNGCTAGAETIRSIEAREGFNIPWAIALETDEGRGADIYRDIIAQGKAMGVFVWVLFARGEPMLELAADHGDCAFVLLCRPGDVTDELLARAGELPNLMLGIRWEEDAAVACARARERRLLYSLWTTYGPAEAALDDLLVEAETMHPIFTLLAPEEDCPAAVRAQVYDQVRAIRAAQRCQTVPYELLQDGLAADAVISDGACSAFFDAAGTLHPTPETGPVNLFDRSLQETLRLAFPKHPQR